MTDNSFQFSAKEKEFYLKADKANNDDMIARIKTIYLMRGGEDEPYYLKSGDFAKSYHQWQIGDLAKIDKGILQQLHFMAEIDDDAHLQEIMPDYFKGSNGGDLSRPGGGVERFKHYIEATYYYNDDGYKGMINRGRTPPQEKRHLASSRLEENNTPARHPRNGRTGYVAPDAHPQDMLARLGVTGGDTPIAISAEMNAHIKKMKNPAKDEPVMAAA